MKPQPSPAPSRAKPNSRPGQKDGSLDRTAELLVTALMAEDSTELVEDLATNLLDEAVVSSGGSSSPKTNHFLCELLEQLVIGIRSLIELPNV